MSLVIHQSGIEAAINAQANGFSGATLSAVDLYNGNTLIKRLPLKGVQVIEPTRIYVVAVDETVGSAYDVTRMEFRTDGNVLYATAQLADGGIIQSKGPYTTLMLTEQINLSAAPGTIAPSGDLSLYAPQATEEMLGAAEIATQAEVDAGTDNTRFVTSKKLKTWWDKLRTWANIKDKPDTATRWPSFSEVTGKPGSYTPSAHRHSFSNLDGVPAQATRWPSFSEVTGKPGSYTPSAHRHSFSNLDGVPAQATRWPSFSEVTGKPTLGSAAGKNAGESNGQVALIGPLSTSGNTAVVVASGSNANGHYRIWSDGYKEQWGIFNGGAMEPVQINFPTQFSNENTVSVVLSLQNLTYNLMTSTSRLDIQKRSRTSFSVIRPDSATNVHGFFWRACGL